MRRLPTTKTLFLLPLLVLLASGTLAQQGPPGCPRPPEGSPISEPEDLRSQDGILRVELAFRSERDAAGRTNFCYVDRDGHQAPTLRLHPGDTLILLLTNQARDSAVPVPGIAMPAMIHDRAHGPAGNTCGGPARSPVATNLHFHGLEIPPVCHQDETLQTRISPGDPPFEYRFQIPTDAAPGLYWYHPHPHGYSKAQVLGGASGALVVEGVEREVRLVAGLAERILVIRDQDLAHPDAEPVKSDSMPAPVVLRDAEGDILNSGTGAGKPAKDLSVNFVPVSFPAYEPAVIRMKPGSRELWRALNASAITYLDLQVLADGKPQLLGVIALDGVPVREAGNAPHDIVWRSHLLLPPAGRVEFVVKGPAAGSTASLVTRTVDTGPAGENDPTRPLAALVASAGAPETHSRLPLLPVPRVAPRNASSTVASLGAPPAAGGNPQWVGNVPAARERRLYFSEEPENPTDPNSPTKFYVTVEGQTPKQFDMNDTAPNIIVPRGSVEEWTIENRTRELHAFHIHQIHFELLEWNGVPLEEPYLRDTINVPYWDGTSTQYPSVKLKMDFRDPRIVGTFMYHCHLLEHEDGGMMGTVRVE